MLYVGNFSYNDDADDTDNYCLAPAVVEADSPDAALDLFSDLLVRVRSTSSLLDGAHEVYLDSLMEIKGSPTQPVLAYWQKIAPALDDDGLCSITTLLPDCAIGDATQYGWGDGDDEDEEDKHEHDASDEPVVADEEPFLTFEEDA
jgi:hypothetical protein